MEICNIPANLYSYDLEPEMFSGISTEPSEICYVCRRVYGQRDAPDDATEVPCIAVALRPCNHLIGDECLHKLLGRGMRSCHICGTTISIFKYMFPRWIRYLVQTKWFRDQVWFVRWRADAQFLDGFQPLLDSLSFAELTRKEALSLWVYHLRGAENFVIHILEARFPMIILSIFLDWYFSPQLIEILYLNADFGLPQDYWRWNVVPALFVNFVLSLYIRTFAVITFPQCLDINQELHSFLWIRAWTNLLGWEGVVIAAVLNAAAFGLIAFFVIFRARALIPKTRELF